MLWFAVQEGQCLIEAIKKVWQLASPAVIVLHSKRYIPCLKDRLEYIFRNLRTLETDVEIVGQEELDQIFD